MSNVIPFTRPLEFDEIVDELRQIVGPDTTGIVLIASSDETIAVRTFGDHAVVSADLAVAALEINQPEAYAH